MLSAITGAHCKALAGDSLHCRFRDLLFQRMPELTSLELDSGFHRLDLSNFGPGLWLCGQEAVLESIGVRLKYDPSLDCGESLALSLTAPSGDEVSIHVNKLLIEEKTKVGSQRFELMWLCIIHEVLNANKAGLINELRSYVKNGKLTKTQFIREMLKLDIGSLLSALETHARLMDAVAKKYSFPPFDYVRLSYGRLKQMSFEEIMQESLRGANGKRLGDYYDQIVRQVHRGESQ